MSAAANKQSYNQQAASTYSQAHQPGGVNTAQAATPLDHYSAPQSRYPQPSPANRSTTTTTGYNVPRPVEVYHLPESANAAIPQDIREQFQRDDKGNVLFFTAPPVDVLPPLKEGFAVGHTARHLANKLRHKVALEERRKAAALPTDAEEPPAKKLKALPRPPSQQDIVNLRDRGVRLLIDQINQGTEYIYQRIYGDQWEEGMKHEREKLFHAQEAARKRKQSLNVSKQESKEHEKTSLRGPGLYLDDYDPRY